MWKKKQVILYVFVQRSVEQEEMLRKHAESLQQQRAELHSCISELEEENLNLREHLQELTGAGKLTFTSHSIRYLDKEFMPRSSQLVFLSNLVVLVVWYFSLSVSLYFSNLQGTILSGGTVTQKYMKMLQDCTSSYGQITAWPDSWERQNIDLEWKKKR